ncbi:MAG: hypothetical protein Q8O67_03505 [Deltaproteobacteria bacterium]|nr:hypothetical protein [Deltaproteobacteria bacterium]
MGPTTPTPTPTPNMQHVGSAVVVAASTFFPLPVVDEWIASVSRKQLVARALQRHGRTFAIGDVKPLYNHGSLWNLPWRIAKGILMAPINKVLKKVLFVFAIRDLVLAMGKTIALGHTLDRELRLGAFRDDDKPAFRRDAAARTKQALDHALSGVDRRLLQRAARAAIAQARKKPNDAAAVDDVEGFLAEIDRRVDEHLGRIT